MFKVTLATVFAPVDAARQMHVSTRAHVSTPRDYDDFCSIVAQSKTHANAVNIKCIVEITSIRQN